MFRKPRLRSEKEIRARREELENDLIARKSSYKSNPNASDRELIELLGFLIAEYKFILKEID